MLLGVPAFVSAIRRSFGQPEDRQDAAKLGIVGQGLVGPDRTESVGILGQARRHANAGPAALHPERKLLENLDSIRPRIHLSPAASRNELRCDPSPLPGLRISETRETTEGSAELEFRIQFPPARSLQTFGSWQVRSPEQKSLTT